MRTEPISSRSSWKRVASSSFIAAVVAVALPPMEAAAASWRDHAPPYVFLFNNHIDTHQQTFINQDGKLFGFFYVKFTGAVTADGLRVAQHVDCGSESGCTAGWKLNGRQATATFLYHVMPDHPVWLVDRRSIPQPGAYTHFHWLGAEHPVPGEQRDGYLLELQAIDIFCFVHEGAPPAAGTCSEIGGIGVVPGLDTATHTNIVSSYAPPDDGGH